MCIYNNFLKSDDKTKHLNFPLNPHNASVCGALYFHISTLKVRELRPREVSEHVRGHKASQPPAPTTAGSTPGKQASPHFLVEVRGATGSPAQGTGPHATCQ